MAKVLLPPNLGLPYFVGGYFWWTSGNGAVPNTKPMWLSLYTR